jgi:hypothetical protein
LHTQPKNLDLKEELSNYKPEFLEGEDVYWDCKQINTA